MDRRTFIKSAAGLAVLPACRHTRALAPKSVVVVGAGIAGLTCAYELLRRGHDVRVFEATGKAGGHIETLREGLDDGLYVDAGAEHITVPGYEYLRGLADELGLTLLDYPRRKNMYALRGNEWVPFPEPRSVRDLVDEGFSEREARFLAEDPERDVRDLYFRPYVERYTDEYDPFETGLGALDFVTASDFLRREGASEAAVQSGGGGESALYAIWHDAILHLRGVPKFPRDLLRIEGGNQKLPLAIADVLGERIRFGSVVEGIEQGTSGVTVSSSSPKGSEMLAGDYVVLSIPLPQIARIKTVPKWTSERLHAFAQTRYYTGTRLVFQTRTRFWEDGLGPNRVFGKPELYEIWSMAEEVDTPRGLLVGYAEGAVYPQQALEVLTRFYPESAGQIDHVDAKIWPLDAFSPVCERRPFEVGELANVWPLIMEPVGRIHFASSATDNLYWGMEAASRSAVRVARAIDVA